MYNDVRLLIPQVLRKQVALELHRGHRGMEGTKARARLIVYWTGMDNTLQQLCRSCGLREIPA